MRNKYTYKTDYHYCEIVYSIGYGIFTRCFYDSDINNLKAMAQRFIDSTVARPLGVVERISYHFKSGKEFSKKYTYGMTL